jgi:hypothetical protein
MFLKYSTKGWIDSNQCSLPTFGYFQDANKQTTMEAKMLTKTTLALAAAFVLAASAAVAGSNSEANPTGGYRESGAGAFATQGINPIYHVDSAAKCQKAFPKTYDPATMTFVGSDGVRHPCP